MFDCANVEMRELLPELAVGTLDARTRARVEEHVASCAECASELETLKLVRGSFGTAPAIDTQRIVAALPKPPVAAPTPRGAPLRRWADWRVAAALTMMTLGGLSIVVSRGSTPEVPPSLDPGLKPALDSARGDSAPLQLARVDSVRTPDTAQPKVPGGQELPRGQKAQLSFGGGVSDLDETSLKALLGALDEIDRAPIAPSAEPDHSPVLPVIREGTR